PIDENETYRVSVWGLEYGAGSPTAYFAVNFFDSDGDALPGSTSGATGWGGLGTYHYFGRVGQALPTAWTRYEFTFGPAGQGSIPSGARFCRIGALVNFNAVASSQMQFAEY